MPQIPPFNFNIKEVRAPSKKGSRLFPLNEYPRKKSLRPFINNKNWLFGFLIVFATLLTLVFLNRQASFHIPQFTYAKASNPDFVGRQKYLDLLSKDLLASQTSQNHHPPVKIKLLWGKGGFGKSELAVEFASRYAHRFSLIWTFLCDNEEHINQGYCHLAEKLGLASSRENIASVKNRVHFFLENHSFDRPWLIIFDNLEQELKDYPQRGGVILMTSQKQIVSPDFLLEIDPLTKEESLNLLETITLEKRSKEMEQLVEDLAGVPLLINQAAHYIKATPGCTVVEYQKTFSSHLLEKEGVLWEEEDVNQRYLKSLATSWQFPLESLKQENPDALQWLYVCSYLYPNQIPEEWIDGWLSQKLGNETRCLELERKKILSILKTYGIIRYEGKTRTFSLHRFFQYMLRESRSSDKKEDLFQACSLLAKYGKDYRFLEASSTEEGERWFLHANEVREWLILNPIEHSDKVNLMNQASFYEGLARWCIFTHQFQNALEFNYKALELRKLAKGEKSLEAAMIYESIGWTLRKLDRYSDAMDACIEAQQLAHPFAQKKPLEYALILMSKGLVLWRQGEYEEALKCHQESLQLRIQNLGEKHFLVGQTFNDMALCLHDSNRSQEALELYDKALQVYSEAYGKEHPVYALCLQNKAWIMYHQGKYDKALNIFEKVLALLTSIRGESNGDLVYSWNALGWCNMRMGKTKKARKAFKNLLLIGFANYGENTRHTIRAYGGIGWSYIKEGKIDRGMHYFIKQLQLCTKVYQNPSRIRFFLKEFQEALQEVIERGGKTEEVVHAAALAHQIAKEFLSEDHHLLAFFEQVIGDPFTPAGMSQGEIYCPIVL